MFSSFTFKKWQHLSRTFILVFVWFIFLPTPAISESLQILFSNNMAAEHLPCGWKPAQLGGLSGKATIAAKFKQQNNPPTLFVDAGKSLFKHDKKRYNEQELSKAKKIATAHVAMGVDAIAVSGQELMAGDSFLHELQGIGLPLVSANIVANGNTVKIAPYINKKIGSLNLAITALTDKPKQQTSFATLGFKDVLPDLLQQLSAEHDIIILLSNLTRNENQMIANSFPEIDVLMSSDRSHGKMSPVVTGNALMTQTSSRGKYVGKLEIEWNGGSVWHNERLQPVSSLEKKRHSISEKFDHLKNQDNTNSQKQLARLRQQLKKLDKEIEVRLSKEAALTSPENTYKLSFLPVRPAHTPIEIEKIVQDIVNLKMK